MTTITFGLHVFWDEASSKSHKLKYLSKNRFWTTQSNHNRLSYFSSSLSLSAEVRNLQRHLRAKEAS